MKVKRYIAGAFPFKDNDGNWWVYLVWPKKTSEAKERFALSTRVYKSKAAAIRKAKQLAKGLSLSLEWRRKHLEK